MSSLFGSVTIKGNRLTDFAQTTATVGITLPFGYGTVPFDGNVIWAPLPPKEHVTKKRQGKGGTKTETYTYTLSYAVAFCKGPIYGFWWIKRNGKVVYTQDPNAPIEDQAYAAKWAQKVQFYFGTPTQLPDSTIESYEGSGQVSAFRDLAYFVVEDDDVTDGSGAVPTYEACCIMDGIAYVTSPPYVLEDTIEMGVAARGSSLMNTQPPFEIPEMGVSAGPVDMENRLMRQLQDVQMGDVSVGSEPVDLENKLMRQLQDVQMGEYGVSSAPVEIENLQVRVVLDRTQIPEYSVSSAPISIEVVIP